MASVLNFDITSRKFSDEKVRCNFVKGIKTYGRKVGVCYYGRKNLGVEIVRAGWGIAYRYYLHQVPELKQTFIDAEEEAKAAKRGIWQGKFVEPSKWRRGERLGC